MLNWKDAKIEQPDENKMLLVIDYWNIDEDEAREMDVEEIERHESDKTGVFGFRFACYMNSSGETLSKKTPIIGKKSGFDGFMWRASYHMNLQRVKFRWYVEMDNFPEGMQLIEVGEGCFLGRV